MDKKIFILIVIGICILIGVSIVVSSFEQSPSASEQAIVSPSPVAQGASGSTTDNQSASSPVIYPVDVVRKFYTSYMSGGVYKKSPYLTTEYKDTITGFTSGSTSPDYDPIFCTSNKTKNPAIEPASYNDIGNQATVVIHDGDIDGGKSLYKVVLKHVGKSWLINDIICLP